MMCVSVCEQPVSPGPVPIHREGAQVYTIGGIAFGASDSVSEVRADDEPCDNSANETVTVNSTARAELQAAGIDMAFHDLLLASGLDLETLQVKLLRLLHHQATDHTTRTVRHGGIGTGISEASKRVPIFSFAGEVQGQGHHNIDPKLHSG